MRRIAASPSVKTHAPAVQQGLGRTRTHSDRLGTAAEGQAPSQGEPVRKHAHEPLRAYGIGRPRRVPPSPAVDLDRVRDGVEQPGGRACGTRGRPPWTPSRTAALGAVTERTEQLRSFPDIGRDDLIRFFTLTPADVGFVDPGRGRGPADRLGLAVQFCAIAVAGVRTG
ncbi:DUF4158 domain-containing protein [Nonomuraea muscovyensis]|uniref:DUF4158 domain-containing protein n=1 Tax=Nonomuraea muscovyensis TaxID=1124761 RepID=UPI0033D23DF6